MLVKHCWFDKEIKKEVDDSDGLDFLLTNGLGGYLSLPNQIASRYHGWFFTQPDLIGEKIFKVIENIELPNESEIFEIRNNFWNIERKRKNIIESFFLPNNYNSLVYELNQETKIELFLDAKESYDNQEFGRFYEIFKESGVIIIKCQNNKDIFYLAIKIDKINYFKIGEWILRDYQLDKSRGSFPSERYIFKSLSISAQKIVFSVNFERDKAIKEAEEVFQNIERLKKIEKEKIDKVFLKLDKKDKRSQEIDFAYLCAKNSLNSLVTLVTSDISESKKSKVGLYAGLPWFFQFWSRDELISLKFLNKSLQKKILLRQFNNIKKISDLDSLGWLFYRASEMMDNPEIKKLFFTFIDKFEILDARLTWMDTLSRPKAIELFALKLQMYKTAYQYSGDKKFLQKEKEILKYCRANFWNGKILADTPNNFVIRPNIFLVAYIYPEFLSKKEWITCFENSLPKLWLEWGGVTTIDKTNFLFISEYSGENSKSYHNGDSWFWINNLTGLVLAQVDKKRFKKYIDQILIASADEILWQGAIGHHTELSSANKLKSEGCWAQAWSNALYIELVDYYFTCYNLKGRQQIL